LGHLQTNKVGKALDIFEMIQSVDSYRLAEELSTRAVKREKEVDILIEVNTSGESTKYGIGPDDAMPLLKQVTGLGGIRVRGLMTLGLFAEDPELARPCFIRLRELRDRIEDEGLPPMELLSMGMSNDFEVAIEEGANIVRVGTAIFGPRRR
jgi:pyridoxal phosphate enzyme (YggS family)